MSSTSKPTSTSPGTRCIILGCDVTSKKNPSLKFFRIPNSKFGQAKRARWIAAIKVPIPMLKKHLVLCLNVAAIFESVKCVIDYQGCRKV